MIQPDESKSQAQSTAPEQANEYVRHWVDAMVRLCCPEHVFWCNGSEEEKSFLTARAVDEGVLIPLNPKKLPGCHYHRSDPNDVARVEQCTYVCTETRNEAGPTNNWMSPKEMYQKLHKLCEGGMQGRTLYVVPYLIGPLASPLSRVGIELTDSLYVVLSMRIMTRMGEIAYRHLGERNDFNRGLHCMLDVHPDRRYIVHFPQDNKIYSVGSNYGGNVLLSKKCLSLRIGSYLARKEGWMAEHMLILGVESPEGEKTYVAAAFPSACGKTNFSMLIPPAQFKGWKVWTVGDDIAWMKPGPDQRLYAINPETGYFGVVPGTNYKSNPNVMKIIARDTIYTNVALTSDRDVWWEGKDGAPPEKCLDWRGKLWTPNSKERAAHPNSRFAAPMYNNPILDPEADNPNGVPISAIIFGGRRATTLPLVSQTFNWTHGVFVGATMRSEMTAAAVGGRGQLRRDPMAMLPFCGYNMGTYFAHWLKMGKSLNPPPKIFQVNWFRKDKAGNFIWPGFGENMRVLKWIVDRCHDRVSAVETPIGWMPAPEDIDIQGLENFDKNKMQDLLSIDLADWKEEVLFEDDLFLKLDPDLPKEFFYQKERLIVQME